MAEKKKYIKICPKCKSTSISTKFTPQIALGIPTEYCCDDCGFTSMLFPEVEAEVRHAEKKEKEKKEKEEEKE